VWTHAPVIGVDRSKKKGKDRPDRSMRKRQGRPLFPDHVGWQRHADQVRMEHDHGPTKPDRFLQSAPTTSPVPTSHYQRNRRENEVAQSKSNHFIIIIT
jgi:hypothetical protein